MYKGCITKIILHFFLISIFHLVIPMLFFVSFLLKKIIELNFTKVVTITYNAGAEGKDTLQVEGSHIRL